MGDRINKFLAGKKKYSVFIATFLTAVVTTFVGDPQRAAELQEFVPLLAMLVSGVAYLVVEGWNDIRRAEAEQAYYTMLSTKPQVAQAEPAAQPAPVPQPFDEAEFIRGLHTAAGELAKKAFPEAPRALTSLYRAAEQLGQQTECTDIRQALAYWRYLQGLAEDAWKELEFNNKDPNGCKLHPPDLYEFRATCRRATATLEELENAVRAGFDWRQCKSTTQGTPTLYSVGELAA